MVGVGNKDEEACRTLCRPPPHRVEQRGCRLGVVEHNEHGRDAGAGQVELDEIAAELNGRPRQTLGWATPAEKMEALLR